MRDLQLVNGETGEGYAVEFLAVDPNFKRVFLFYRPSLERLGITVTVRTVDAAQYENRLRNRDFEHHHLRLDGRNCPERAGR